MPESMLAMSTYSTKDFLSSQNLVLADETVAEVFGMMLGFQTETVPPEDFIAPSDEEQRTAVVGFSGALRGSCEVRMTSNAARSITSAMLGGVPVDEADDSIGDAVGELCNMVAGGWKNRIPTLSSKCSLSPPTVISGQNYKVHMTSPSVKLSRTYQFDIHTMQVTLHCEEQKAA